jgi:hypothetical protein
MCLLDALIPQLAWSVPLIGLTIGLRHGFKRANTDEQYPVQLLPLWTAEISATRE